MTKRNPRRQSTWTQVRQDLLQFARELHLRRLWQRLRAVLPWLASVAAGVVAVTSLIGRQLYRPPRYAYLKLARQYSSPKGEAVEIQQLYMALRIEARWNANFIVLTSCSCAIATFGLIANSAAAIIGAMLVAPLMLPLRALSFAALEGDVILFRRALGAILGGTAIGIGLSWMIGEVANLPEFGSEVLARTQPNLVDLGIAVVAGGISGFAKVRREISDALAGTAIAVALMPPLCVVGLGLSQNEWTYSQGAFLLYATNLLGISLSCMGVFIWAGYARLSRAFGWALALTTLLLVPLGASFARLVEQAQLERELVNILKRETVTVGQNVEQARIAVDWSQEPPVASVLLQTDKSLVPNQVRLAENFVSERLGRPVRLVLFLSELERVVADDGSTTSDEGATSDESAPTTATDDDK